MHRQFADELGSWLMRQPAFDPFRYFIDMADNRVPFGNLGKTKTLGQPLPLTYGAKRVPSNVVFIDEDVTRRNDAARRLLADPSVTNIFFTDAGALQVTNVDIDLAPELKELIGPSTHAVAGPRKRRAGTNPTS